MNISVPFVDKVCIGSGRVVPVLQARINATADGDNEIIAAPGAGYKIVPLGVFVTGITTGIVTYKSGSSTTLWTMNQANTLFIAFSLAPYPLPACSANEAFVVNNAAGTDCIGTMIYCVVPV